MTKVDKMLKKLNENFKECLYESFLDEYNIKIETYHDILGDMKLHSTRIDKKDFTNEQKIFIDAFELGYVMAIKLLEMN